MLGTLTLQAADTKVFVVAVRRWTPQRHSRESKSCFAFRLVGTLMGAVDLQKLTNKKRHDTHRCAVTMCTARADVRQPPLCKSFVVSRPNRRFGCCTRRTNCAGSSYFFLAPVSKVMKKTVGCFTQEQLAKLSEQENVSVYQPVHDITYEPWTASRVSQVVDNLVVLTRSGSSPTEAEENAEIREFASKYTVFFQKLTNPAFVADPENIVVMKRLIALRAMVEQGILDETAAQAQSADIALKSLMTRVKSPS